MKKITWEHPFIFYFAKFTDLLILSVIYIITCLPLVTIGVASTSLYYTVVKVIRRNRSTVIKEYFSCFKLNFKQGLTVGMIQVLLQFILLYNMFFASGRRALSSYGIKGVTFFSQLKTGGFFYLYLILFIISIFVSIYLYPILSRYQMRMVDVYRLSLYCVFKHFLTTIVAALIYLGAIMLSYYSLLTLLVILPALSVLVVSIVMEKVLIIYIPKGETGETIDEWYRE